ncbi:MAG TPA: tetratricopeptide repeat protein [Ignavibacteriaceae bacterium]|nr:tetratricopeptide repeat protein [Ignavibacteriaceae bacterium]
MFNRISLFLILLNLSIYSQQDLSNKFMLGQNFEQAGEFARAKQIFEELYKQQPANFQFFDALNRMYLQLKEYDNSVKIIEQRLISNPQDVNLYGLLGKTHYLKGDEQKAFETWDEAIKKFPDDINVYRTMANYAIERRSFEKAVDILNKGKEITDDPRIFSFDLANIYSLMMRYREAANEYFSIISSHPNQYQLVESKILSYLNKPDAMEQTLDALEEYSTGDLVQFDYLYARLLVEKNELNKAFEIYLEIDKKQNNLGADLYNFANFAYMEKDFELAAKVFNEVIQRYPNSPVISSAKLGFAKTMEESLNKKSDEDSNSWKPFYKTSSLSTEEIEKVVNAYVELVELYPQSEIAGESLLRIGKIYLYKNKNLSSAADYLNRIIYEYLNSRFIYDAYKELAEINILKNEIELAEQNLKNIVENNRAAEDQKNIARFELAKVKFYNGDFSSSKNHLAEVLSNLKDNIANDAIDLSLLLNTNMNDSSNLLRFANAEKLIAQEKYDEALVIFKEIAKNQQGFVLQNKAELRVAEIELAIGKLDESIKVLLEISSENEKNIYADRALYLLGRIYLYGLKDDIKAAEMYESLLAKFPNSLYLDEAREEIIKIRDKFKQGT